MENIKAVLFDLDNTLINRRLGAHDTYELMLKEKTGLQDKVELETIVQDCMIWDMNGAVSRKFMCEQLNKKYNINITYEEAQEFWVKNIGKHEKPFPKTYEVLNYLRQRYRLGIVTNGLEHIQASKIAENDLASYFDCIVIGATSNRKPLPDVFNEATRKLQVKNEETVFVGDTYSTDIIGAYRLNMKPIWFWPDASAPNNDGITRICDIGELMDIL